MPRWLKWAIPILLIAVVANAAGGGDKPSHKSSASLSAGNAGSGDSNASRARKRERRRREARRERRAERRRARARAAARVRRAERRARRREARRQAEERRREEARAAAERKHQEASSSRGSDCDPSYRGACLDPNASDYDCAGGSGNGPEYVDGPVEVVGDDHFGLDADGDGTGCE